MSGNQTTALYASTGSTLLQYTLDVEGAAIESRGSVTLPVGVQYAWPHPHLPYLYVACSNGSPGVRGDTHCAVAPRIGPKGVLEVSGEPVKLPARPIHITTDTRGEYALIAYNNPSGLTVHRIAQDGALGPEVHQQAAVDAGIFAHQVRVTPSNETVILVTRGNDATNRRREDPGALKLFGFHNGQLTHKGSVAPNAGFGFGPRHLDFHPTKPWIYVSLERQNEIHMYRAQADVLEPEPAFVRETLASPEDLHPEQRAGTIHVHPRGHVVYVANRASGTTAFEGRAVFAGGENNIVVYAIDSATGEPTVIQHVDTRGFVPRTFAIDASGRMLVVANSERFAMREDGDVKKVSASLVLFRIRSDGKLTYASKYDIDTGGATLFWMGLVPVSVQMHSSRSSESPA